MHQEHSRAYLKDKGLCACGFIRWAGFECSLDCTQGHVREQKFLVRWISLFGKLAVELGYPALLVL
jgi:hypothetical protein